jgi:hypothetical protein
MAAGATHQTTVEENRWPWTTPVPQGCARMGRRQGSGWARAAGGTDGRRHSPTWRDFPCSSIIRHHAADRLAGPSRGSCACATRNECKRDAGLASAAIRHPAAIRSDLDHVAECVSEGPRFPGEILCEPRTITDTRWTPVATPGRPRQGAPPSNRGATPTIGDCHAREESQENRAETRRLQEEAEEAPPSRRWWLIHSRLLVLVSAPAVCAAGRRGAGLPPAEARL